MKYMEPKTLEEHRDYLYRIVQLKLFFLHRHLSTHPEEAFSNAIRNRVDIYRKTDANPEGLNPVTLHFDEHPWLDMERAAEKLWEKDKDDPASFEQEAFQVFKPSIDARLIRDYQDRSGTYGYQCGSLRHAFVEDKKTGRRTLYFHIANAIAPHSIFEDPKYLKLCFSMLLWTAENMYQADEIATRTWLNQLPVWLRFFPEEWKAGMSSPDTDVQWHYGFWGQFISARGTFNGMYAAQLRATGRLPYYPCFAHCSVKAMRTHLNSCMQEA